MNDNERLAEIARVEQEFKEYCLRNPQAKFRDFYVHEEAQSIANNNPHPTLGIPLKSGKDWSEVAREQLDFLVDDGLQPHHTVVDYGCGSLRLGQHLIRYLQPGLYWGLDITDTFIQMGVAQLGYDLMEAKRPHLKIISRGASEEARKARPDFVWCRAVLRHVPPAELNQFFDELMSVMAENTVAWVTGLGSDDVERLSGVNWAYPDSLLEEHVRRCGGSAVFYSNADWTDRSGRAGPYHSRSIRMRVKRLA